MAASARLRAHRPPTGFSRDGLLEIALGLFLAVAAFAIIVDIPWLALAVPAAAAAGWGPLQRRLGDDHLSGEDGHGRWRWRWLLLAVALVVGAGLLDLAITGSVLHWWIRGDGLTRLGLALGLGLALVAWSHHRADFYGYAAITAAVFLGFQVIGAGPVNALLVTGLAITTGGAARLAGFVRRKRAGVVRAPRRRPAAGIALDFSIPAPADRAWRIGTDPRQISEWQPGVRSVRVHTERSYDLVYRLGRLEGTTPVEVLRWEPPELIVIQGRMPVGGRYTATMRLHGNRGATRVSFRIDYTVLPGRFGWWLDRLLLGRVVRAYVGAATSRLTALVEARG